MEMEGNKICTVSGGGAEGVIPTEFEKMMDIVRNTKCAGKYWIAGITKNGLDFLSPIEGSRGHGLYSFRNGEFYIVLDDFSSWKNSRCSYTLYYAINNDLNMIASITFINNRKEMDAIDDDIKTAMKQFYKNESNGSKVINTLIKTAKYYAEREGIIKVDIKQMIKYEIEAMMEKYNISKEDLISIIGGDN